MQVRAALNFLIDHNKIINVTLAVGFGAVAALLKYIGEPWLWELVDGILRGFQKDVFAEMGQGEFTANHRVTLYRRVRWCWFPRGRGTPVYWPWGRGNWPWSGWLVPVVRAGPESAGTTVFLARDGAQFDGVCGAAYFQQSAMLELNAADLPDITSQSEQAEILRYANGTFVSADMIKRRIQNGRPCARCFLALRVEVQFKKWGVLMIDSRANEIPRPNITVHRFRQIKDVLAHLLRRAQ